jgi:gliding motility-associated-like protein
MKRKIFPALIFLLFVLSSGAQTVAPGFIAPDTVCINHPFSVQNTSIGATNYYWSFCSASLTQEPTIENLGGFSGTFNQPVFLDYVFTNNKYYGFVSDYRGGNLIRLDFGNSLLNTPVPTNLGNFGGLLPSGVGAEGIQVVQNEGKWYLIIVSGYTPSGSDPKIIRIAFGSNIDNPSPVATDWGNLGNLSQPIDLHLFMENGNWYGLTVNAENNTITRFSFGTSFENPPTGTNLGNIGNLQYPTGLYAINDSGTWRVFVTNAGDRTRNGGPYSLTRLDFGNSLLNIPTGTNLGNLGNTLGHPRDLTIIRSCDETIGFVVNGNTSYNDVVRINFHDDLTSVPTATPLSIGGFDFPHSISKLFRVNENVYGFVTDAQNNTISRISFKGCNNASFPSSTVKDPPDISYNQPGTYNINLTIDIGLPTQSSFCHQVVAVNCYDSLILGHDTTICKGQSLQLKTVSASNYKWTPAAYLDDPFAANPTATPLQDIVYYVEATVPGLLFPIRDSIRVTVKSLSVKTNADTAICSGSSIQLNTNNGTAFLWSPVSGLSDPDIKNPVAAPTTTTEYHVIATDEFGCTAKDTVLITVKPIPEIAISGDTLVCKGTPVQLYAAGGISYKWSPAINLNDPLVASPTAVATESRMYKVKVTGSNQCSAEDSVTISIRPLPTFNASGNKDICVGSQLTLVASGGDSYEWSSTTVIPEPNSPQITVTPSANTTYTVNIAENTCNFDTVINLPVKVRALPEFSSLPNAFTPNNDGKNDCFGVRQWGDAKIEQFMIYNRWGQIVFETKNSHDCWDGTFKGISQASGGYVYIIRAGTVCGYVFKKGIVTLIR